METRKKTFEGLLRRRNWYKDTSITKGKAQNYKVAYANGSLSIDKQCEILKECGYTIAQEEKWEKSTG